MRLPARLLPSTITVRPFLRVDGYNNPVYGDPVQLRARIAYENRLVRDSRGEEVVASGTVTLRPETSVPLGSLVTTPDGEEHRVLSAGEQTGRRHPDVLQLDIT